VEIMSYELKMIIGNQSSSSTIENITHHIFFEVIATIELGAVGNELEFEDFSIENECNSLLWYWFMEDGTTKVYEDKHGMKPYPVTCGEVVEALDRAYDESVNKVYMWAGDLLRSMMRDGFKPQVLFYGH
jgi:hypothetical protein